MIDNTYAILQPSSKTRLDLHRDTSSDFRYCFSCKSCAVECPVNIFTGRLNPVRLVRLASFGLKEILIRLSEIWYCLGCGKCSNICPMSVKPHRLISSMCNEAINNRLISPDIRRHIFELFVQFQWVRLQLVHSYINGKDIDEGSLEDWDSLTYSFVDNLHKDVPIILGNIQKRNILSDYKGISTEINACLTCRECSNACPVCLESKVFDPLFLFRAVALGLKDDLLSMPSIWLCIECETCSNSCAQGVKGHLIMKRLKKMAIEAGILDNDFFSRWNDCQKKLFNVLLNKVDLALEKFRL